MVFMAAEGIDQCPVRQDEQSPAAPQSTPMRFSGGSASRKGWRVQWETDPPGQESGAP